MTSPSGRERRHSPVWAWPGTWIEGVEGGSPSPPDDAPAPLRPRRFSIEPAGAAIFGRRLAAASADLHRRMAPTLARYERACEQMRAALALYTKEPDA